MNNYQNKYLKYKKKYLDVKYGGTISNNTLEIRSMNGDIIFTSDIDSFDINTLVGTNKIFNDYAFRIVDGLTPIYSDDVSYEENVTTINAYKRKIEDIKNTTESNIFSLSFVKLKVLFTDCNEEISSNIVSLDETTGELKINLNEIPDLLNKYYINLSGYTDAGIKKITTVHNENKLFKIILPYNEHITELGNYFFAHSKIIVMINLYSLTNLEKIGTYFLSKSGIIDIDLEKYDKLVKIGDSFLENCEKLKSVKLPKYIKEIGNNYLKNSSIETVDLEKNDKLVKISNSFLENCKKLKSVKLPESITEIGDSYLEKSSITTVDLENHDELVKIKNSFLAYCEKLKTVKLPKSIMVIGDYYLMDSSIETVDLEKNDKLVRINDNFLQNCKNLTSVKLPESITEIGDSYLENSSIETVDLEKNDKLVRISESFLPKCENLKSVKFSATPFKITHGRKYGESDSKYLQLPIPFTTLEPKKSIIEKILNFF